MNFLAAATVTACGTAHTITATKPTPALAEDLVHNLGTAG